jgi:hypothetical protein
VTFFGMAVLAAAATAVLAVFAIVTAWYARRAFLKQSQEVAAIETQVADGQQLTRQQGELIQVQTGQLDALRGQLEEQRKASGAQAEVLELQAAELRESLAERTRQAEQMRRAQAARVFLTEEPFASGADRRNAAFRESLGVSTPPFSVTVTAHNTSDQPIYDAELYWHRGSADHGDPNPEPVGTLLPGATHTSTRVFPPETNLEVSGAVLRFRDASGTKWTRRADGYLEEQS